MGGGGGTIVIPGNIGEIDDKGYPLAVLLTYLFLFSTGYALLVQVPWLHIVSDRYLCRLFLLLQKLQNK